MRVKPATEKPQRQAKLPGDEFLRRGFERLEHVMPQGGPGHEE
jgi:hypothetical protein